MAPFDKRARLPIAQVTTWEDHGLVGRESLVACRRRGEQTSTERCARCPWFVKVVPGAADGPDLLECLEPACPAVQDEVREAVPPSIAQLMTRDVICVGPDASLDLATALFLEHGLAALPIVDARRRLLGFVGEVDVLLEVQAARSDPDGARLVTTVGELATPLALAIHESASIQRAAQLLALEGQKRLAVVSSEGAVVGVLSAGDILRWLGSAPLAR